MHIEPVTDITVLKVNEVIDLDTLSLTPMEGYVVSRLHGPTSVGEIYNISIMDRTATALLIKGLMDKSVLVPVAVAIPVQEIDILPKAETAPGHAQERAREVKPARAALKKDVKYKDFIFDLMLLTEEVDLNIDQKKDIIYKYQKSKEGNYFEILDIDTSADDSDVKNAYLLASRTYHPDRFFRKKLGSFQKMISAVYVSMSDAHLTLIDPGKRARYMKIHKAKFGDGRPVDKERDDAEKLRQDRMKKTQEERRIKSNPMLDRIKKAREYFKEGKKAQEASDFLEACNLYQLAQSFDPLNEIYRTKIEEVANRARIEKAKKLMSQAQIGETYVQDGYLDLYEKAAEMGSGVASIQYDVSRVFLEHNDAQKAKKYLKRAAEKLDPGNIQYRMEYGKLLLALKNREEAAKQFEAVLVIKPEHEQAKELLKEAKRWF